MNVELLKLELTQGYVATHNGRTPSYSFAFKDAHGRSIWTGRDFVSPESRAAAISVAKRSLSAM